MKNLEIMGVQEMDAKEMRNENGGIIWFVVAAVALITSSCTINVNTGSGNINNSTSASADSTKVTVGHGSANDL